jgi:hypothetical protein
MEDHSTPPLFDLKARQLDYRLSAHFLHFNDGLNVLHFTRTTINPFQVITWHIGEIPPAWMTDHGKYACFRAGLTIVGSSQEVRDELTGSLKTRRAQYEKHLKRAPGPLPYPSWWVE